jgi:hypothetical protein
LSSERQLGLLWGAIAALVLAISPLAERLAAALPGCAVKAVAGLPCLTCGTTRAGLALARLDLLSALAINPVAALGWTVLVVGGLAAGTAALVGRPIREPDWRLSRSWRIALVLVLVFNWLYLFGSGA